MVGVGITHGMAAGELVLIGDGTDGTPILGDGILGDGTVVFTTLFGE